jgi:hypothetical protein
MVDEEKQFENLTDQAERLSEDARNFLTVAFLMGGGVCIVSGHSLAENTGLIGWLAALVLVEPVGLLAISAALFVQFPRSPASRWFRRAYSHAKPGLTLLTILMTWGVLASIAWFIFQI